MNLVGNVGIYTDYIGRRILGEVVEDAQGIATLRNPVTISETARNGGDGRTHVDLGFSPEFHTIDITELDIKWCKRYAIDDKLKAAYNEYVLKIRAARQGISLVSNIPSNIGAH